MPSVVRRSLVRSTVWLHRFEDRRIAGREDHPRGGRPPTYSREQVSQIIATALERPEKLGLPYASWTLDRLVDVGSPGGLSGRAQRHQHEAPLAG
jgi:transposase